jgi:hypothetical protein
MEFGSDTRTAALIVFLNAQHNDAIDSIDEPMIAMDKLWPVEV